MPPSGANALDTIQSLALEWAVMVAILAAVAFVVARQLGGTSRKARIVIFQIILFVGLAGITFMELRGLG